ncbi:MAG: AMP-binding protein [Prevotella sp.]|nr:AMP-binding protein [Prevotella sp.]
MNIDDFYKEWNNPSDKILVHTSGSTGKPKPIWVEKSRMEASARITCDFLGLQEGDTALLCMSLDFIAGKMMVVRSLVLGLELIVSSPSGHPLSNEKWKEIGMNDITFAAMVPLQVYNSLQVPEERERLMRIKHLIIGGGAIDDELEQALKTFPNAVWSTYGMTETLSHIALRRLSGNDSSDWYTPFPSVNISLDHDGCLVIDAPLVCPEVLKTNDMAEIRNGQFRILGRKDNVIVSGGIKIQMEEVERLLKQHIKNPFLITKRKDNKFGEIVVMLTTDNTNDAKTICERVLPKYWQPRAYLSIKEIPSTPTGKPARKEAERIAEVQVNR